MKYDEKADCYYCKNGQVLTMQYEKREKTARGYRRTVTVYRSNGCSGCPFKTDCIKGNNCKTPMEDRQKVLYVSKKMKEKRQETLERITSDYGTQPNEPKYPGRGKVCKHQRGYGIQTIFISRECKCNRPEYPAGDRV